MCVSCEICLRKNVGKTNVELDQELGTTWNFDNNCNTLVMHVPGLEQDNAHCQLTRKCNTQDHESSLMSKRTRLVGPNSHSNIIDGATELIDQSISIRRTIYNTFFQS